MSKRFWIVAAAIGLSASAVFAAPASSPTDQQAIVQRANARAVQENALIVKANAAVAAKKWQEVIGFADQLLAIEPQWDFYQVRGNANFALGKYQDAVAAYEKGVALAEADKASPTERTKEARAEMLTNRGNAHLKLKENDKAVADFKAAAGLAANPAMAWFNLCATQYNMGDMAGAPASCDQAIKHDPKKADAYFIKGSILYAEGTVGKDGAFVVPPASIAALKAYLKLAPKGPHAADVHAMLDALKPAAKPK